MNCVALAITHLTKGTAGRDPIAFIHSRSQLGLDVGQTARSRAEKTLGAHQVEHRARRRRLRILLGARAARWLGWPEWTTRALGRRFVWYCPGVAERYRAAKGRANRDAEARHGHTVPTRHRQRWGNADKMDRERGKTGRAVLANGAAGLRRSWRYRDPDRRPRERGRMAMAVTRRCAARRGD